MSSLVVTELSKEYATPTEPLRVLFDVSFEMNDGESLAVVGPSGAGKSTLLYILGTLESPTTGSVKLDGSDPFVLRGDALARFRNQQIGFVFQDHYLLPQLTVLDNVRLGALAGGGNASAELTGRAMALIERVGLADRRTHLPSELSGGERQRAAVARALLLSPRLVLADEPTGNLDHGNAMAITQLLLEMQSSAEAEAKPMLVVVTHSHEVAHRMSRQLVLADGTLASESGST